MRLIKRLHRHRNRAAWVIAGALALSTALAACSASSGGSATAASPGSSGTVTLKHGGTLRVGIVSLSTADALDPAMASTEGGYATATQLFDTLDQYGTDGKVTMRLAKSIVAQGSAKTWIVTLRDAKWSDGKPVTADDLIYTIKRILAPKNPLPPASSIPFISSTGMTAVNSHTVKFELKYPTVDFVDAFTSPTMSIVPQGFNPKKPVGSGPFVLASDNPGTEITFTANKNYWNSPQPYVSQLDLISFPNSTAQVNALLGGQIDAASSIDPSLVRVVKAGGSGYSVYAYPTTSTLTWQMNVSKAPFNNPLVREALRLAVDRQQIVSLVYDGYAKVGNDIFSPGDEGYNSSLPQRSQDITKAKQLLAEAGYPNGLSVQLTAAPIYPTANLQNEVLVEQVKAAGFNITFHQVDEATYYGSAYGTYPLSLSFWGDLSIFDQAAFTVVNGAPYNATHWQNATYDALYNQAVRTVDTASRIALVHKMQQIEYDSGAYVVADFMDNITAYRSTVGGQEPYPNTDGASGYYFATMGFKSYAGNLEPETTANMISYVLRRLGYAIVMLAAISVIVFFFTQALPGNVARQILGQNATPAEVSRLRALLGINKPLITQYAEWIRHLVTLNLGTSLTSGTSVTHLIADRAVNSAVLVGITAVVLIPSVLVLGVLAARHPGGVVDSIVSGAVLFVLALPEFIIAILIVVLLATNVFHVLPPTSVISTGAGVSLWSQWNLFVLPVLALVVGSLPYLTESVKTVMREELGSEHITWARLTGIPEVRLLWRHALPNAIGPTLQVAGTTLVYLTGGIVAVENVFAFPGIGAALTAAVANRDIPVVQAIAMLLAAVALVVYLVADVLHLLLSPRLRTAGQ